jgi:hypothetical protein
VLARSEPRRFGPREAAVYHDGQCPPWTCCTRRTQGCRRQEAAPAAGTPWSSLPARPCVSITHPRRRRIAPIGPGLAPICKICGTVREEGTAPSALLGASAAPAAAVRSRRPASRLRRRIIRERGRGVGAGAIGGVGLGVEAVARGGGGLARWRGEARTAAAAHLRIGACTGGSGPGGCAG